jgi:hypothetical protein
MNDDEPKKTVELGSQQVLEDMYISAGGKRYFIHGFHRSFFEQLQKLPVAARIELMELSSTQLSNYILERKNEALNKVKQLLGQKWYWKETGDEVEITSDTIPSVPYTIKEMQAKNRAYEVLNKIIDFFEGNNNEVYTN